MRFRRADAPARFARRSTTACFGEVVRPNFRALKILAVLLAFACIVKNDWFHKHESRTRSLSPDCSVCLNRLQSSLMPIRSDGRHNQA